jgi:hypothetical protein
MKDTMKALVIMAVIAAGAIGFVAGQSRGYDAGTRDGIYQGYGDGLDQAYATDDGMAAAAEVAKNDRHPLTDAEVAKHDRESIAGRIQPVTEAQWQARYESGFNRPYCYGHPHNKAEDDIIMQFNADESAAQMTAYERGEISNP